MPADDWAGRAGALLLATLCRLTRQESGQPPCDFALTDFLWGRTIGIFGCGRIARSVGLRMSGFGATVLYPDPAGRRRARARPALDHGTELAFAARSDILVAVPSTGGDIARFSIDAKVLKALGPDGVVLYLAPGAVDAPALLAALESRAILGAGLEVSGHEHSLDPRFLALDNAVVRSHASAAKAGRQQVALLIRGS